MKKITVSVCAVAVVLVAIPAFASVPPERKDDCLLYGKNCPNVVDSLPERIAKLNTEIAKGEKVYTSEELNRLISKLKEDNETMRVLQKPAIRYSLFPRGNCRTKVSPWCTPSFSRRVLVRMILRPASNSAIAILLLPSIFTFQ